MSIDSNLAAAAANQTAWTEPQTVVRRLPDNVPSRERSAGAGNPELRAANERATSSAGIDPIRLHTKQLLRELHREKRRAERSGAPLSMVLYRVQATSSRSDRQTDQFVEMLHRSKRATDVVGHLGKDHIAVLCPDTSADGMHGFMKKVDELASRLQFAGVAATYPDDLFDKVASGGGLEPLLQPYLALDFDTATESGYVLKRTLDILGAALLLVLLAPLMLLVAAAISFTSRGPVIFKQTRMGKGCLPFTFYKFRSMRTNADDSVHREFVAKLIQAGNSSSTDSNAKPAAYKLQADPRITGIGRFIRKTSIDELPQLFNVLKGDMSLVGPRPPIPYEAAQYQPWHLRRMMALRPGLTGIWQVEGRSRVPFNEMVRMDLRYIRECSLLLDLKIILKTVVVVFRGDGAD
jgi:lipopolysaccharide/colanic/teichoic acid biosynthesis glycosyltransferase/GGDEF domain-containing protein